MRITLCLFLSILINVAFAQSKPEIQHFKVEVLSEGFMDPQEMVHLPDGRILICQRTGELRVWTPGKKGLTEGGAIKVANRVKNTARECGFIGITKDPDFVKNNWLYCYYSIPDVSSNRLSRFDFKDGKLQNNTEKVILEVPTDREDSTCHEGGSIAFDSNGLLFLSTGDNTNPFSKPATPIEEDKKERDAQRSSSNSNDLRGKILRIKPLADGTYEIPEGNLFKPGRSKTRPEIFAMGLRNPYRITINPKTDTLYWSEISSDKKPAGEELNQAKTAGYYGWPYVITDTKVFKDLKGEKFDPKNLRNTSKNNTGIINLPVPREPLHFYERNCSIIGEVYHYVDKPGAFPKHFDNSLLFADWNHSWFKFVQLDKDERKVGVEDLGLNFKFRKPIDLFFEEGVLYVLEYGTGWYDVKNGRLLKVSYDKSHNQQLEGADDARIAGLPLKMNGTQEILKANCLSCHMGQEKIVGPSFVQISEKYKNDSNALKNLSAKVKNGSVGVWGEQAMPANPMYKDKQIAEMVKAILATEKLGGHHK